MKNGLYQVRFQTQLGNGAGVVYLQDGKIHGGDGALYYVGQYQLDKGSFSAQVQTGRHDRTAGIPSVFGIDNVLIDLVGAYTDKSATLQGAAPRAPGISFAASLTWLSE
jgi:hypothetical protein